MNFFYFIIWFTNNIRMLILILSLSIEWLGIFMFVNQLVVPKRNNNGNQEKQMTAKCMEVFEKNNIEFWQPMIQNILK